MSELYFIRQRQKHAQLMQRGYNMKTEMHSVITHQKVTHLDPPTVLYLQKVKKFEISEIEREHGCRVEITPSRAGIIDVYDSSSRVRETAINRACAALLRLYEDSRAKLVKSPDDRINIKDLKTSVPDVPTIVDSLNRRYPSVLIINNLEEHNIVFLGSQQEVILAQEEFRSTLKGGQMYRLQEHRVARQPSLPWSTDTTKAVLPNTAPRQVHGYGDLSPWRGMFNGITVKIYQADVTDEQVDVIVTAITSDLTPETSLSRYIARKAGDVFSYELGQTAKRHEQLTVRSVTYTSGGKLACRHVLCVVLPRFDQYSPLNSRELLFGSFVQIFDFANRCLNAKSIAMATLGSGKVHGYQVTATAQTLHAALNAYSSECFGAGSIVDVRLVDIHTTKVSILRDVFKPFSQTVVQPPIQYSPRDEVSLAPIQYRQMMDSRESNEYRIPTKQMSVRTRELSTTPRLISSIKSELLLKDRNNKTKEEKQTDSRDSPRKVDIGVQMDEKLGTSQSSNNVRKSQTAPARIFAEQILRSRQNSLASQKQTRSEEVKSQQGEKPTSRKNSTTGAISQNDTPTKT